MKVIDEILALILKAQRLGSQIGLHNLLQPGLIKEMLIAKTLEHKLIHSKRNADACDPKDESKKYEYLSFKEGGSGQLDRMFKSPEEKRQESLKRITRNTFIYMGVFYQNNQLKIKTIYEIEPSVMLRAAEEKLDRSRNQISHLGFPESWAKQNGKVVYQG